jgi:competence ComEA-like helix-hairpin-helix protein
VREQARYFGVESPERMIWLGRQAADFVEQVLARPFTVHTAHAKALGGARSHRIYGFVVTAAGRDLGELLVENGLGRNFGVSRPRYDGLSSEDVELRLRDLEASAMLATRGVWSESNPARIVEFRAEQRRETAELRTLLDNTLRAGDEPINVNTATRAELERLPGIGPVMAHRIYSGRPFASVEDLSRIPGVGGKTMERLRPFVIVAPGNG